MDQLGIKQHKSSAYHPESQGALERFHQTLKTMIKMYCTENIKDLDEGVHLLLFTVRDSVQESLGFSPFELVFGHTVHGPLLLLKEILLNENPEKTSILQYVATFRDRLFRAGEMARENLKQSQNIMKLWYDKHAR
jgi:transposase InsO family protein